MRKEEVTKGFYKEKDLQEKKKGKTDDKLLITIFGMVRGGTVL